MRALGLALVLAAGCGVADAHLLNMTKVEVAVQGDGSVQVELQIDMTRSAGGSLEYYRLSQVGRPLEADATRALLARLAAAIELRVAAGPGAGSVALAARSAEFPKVSREVFLDPLSWPMTHVVLAGRLPAGTGAQALQAVFQPGFHFEEPIALTIVQMPAQRRMTRWLVTSQTSPVFALDAPDGAAASAAAATSTPAADAATGRDAAPATTGATLAQFVRFGFLHILPRGLDHVLFVLGLFLGARSLKSLLLLVTCFTIAHSITLGLATLGIFRLPSGVVEPLIAASIAWIGIENLRGSARSERYRPFVVFGFGLLHGLGFASALAALDVPRGEFLASLLSFNVGIETGQLAVIAAAFLLTLPWRGGANWRRTIVRPASGLITLVALFWTVQRLVS